ncbi:hypothetical protein CPB85DRAFT_1559508 [Mucidula mucida]|nr:hypothetical protein CPB85DRAFT_1559508 [Mucidula mucida]
MSWLFLTLVVGTLPPALCVEQQPVVRQLIMPGELPIPTSSSSYNYWWPYPPAGTTPTPTPIEYTPLAPDLAVTDTNPVLSFALPTETDVEISSATISTMPLSAPSSTNSTSSPSPSSSLPSFVTITATSLTEVPTLVTYPKKNPETQSPKLMYYLVPVFAIVGIILGSVCAWIVCGCWTRKPRTRRRKHDELEVGPAYGSREWKRKEAIS